MALMFANETYLRCNFDTYTIKPYQTYNLKKLSIQPSTLIKAMQMYHADTHHARDDHRTYIVDGFELELTPSIFKDTHPNISDVIRVTRAT